jgi:uncharacterized protein YgbK (DUF1537 family)
MTSEERFDRIERVLERVADNQARLDDAQITAFDGIEKLAERVSDRLDKLSEKVDRLADAQAETDRQMKALGLVVENTSRQWQAYLNTIRPQ